MRLVKPTERRQALVGQDAFEQLRDLGGRLEYLVARYGRLVTDVVDGRPLTELRDSVELTSNQLGYVARRLQELLVLQYEQRHGEADLDEDVAGFEGALAVGSR